MRIYVGSECSEEDNITRVVTGSAPVAAVVQVDGVNEA